MSDQLTLQSETSRLDDSAQAAKPASALDVLRIRNFRLLWLGEMVSLLGDQFHLIAMPWLVLKLTNDPLAMGTVLALAGVPRAIFMLVGGVLTDRFSPRTLMLGSNLLRMVLVALLALLVAVGQVQLWMIYVVAFLFGLVDAFFFPAQATIVPQLVGKDLLHTANSFVQGTAQLSMLAGPVLAGVLIALLDDGQSVEAAPGFAGIALAFGIDSLTFLVSALTLQAIRLEQPKRKQHEVGANSSVLTEIKEGLAYVWNDVQLRIFFLITAGINFLVSGPFMIGIPVLADSRYPEGAAAYGIILSAFAGGALLGVLAAGILPKPAPQRMGTVLLGVISGLGIGLMLLGFIAATPLAAALALLMGMTNGYVNVQFMTWLQYRTPESIRGRMMSLMMFASLGLLPVSSALSGAIVKASVPALFVGAGLLMTCFTLFSMLHPRARDMSLPAQEAPAISG